VYRIRGSFDKVIQHIERINHFKRERRSEFPQLGWQFIVFGHNEQLWENPQINWDGKNLGCCRNFWGDFGGNAFTDGLRACFNHEKMHYARAMLRGRKPPRDDVPCSTCEMYHSMRDRAAWIGRRDSWRRSFAEWALGFVSQPNWLNAVDRFFARLPPQTNAG
jgi:hypothetical protein